MRVATWICVGLLAACAPEGDELSMSGTSEVLPPPMSLDVPAALLKGRTQDLTVSSGQAGANHVFIASAADSGRQACPQPIAPTCLDLFRPIRVLGTEQADSTGTATLALSLPAGLGLDELNLQVATRTATGGDVTNMVTLAVLDPDLDEDVDGLTNEEELVLGTDWRFEDSDGGGIPDGEEADLGLDPLDPSDDVPACPDLDILDDGSGTNGAVGVPDLVISEIDPGDYIELYNTTGTDIPLANVSHQLCSPFSYRGLSVLAPSVVVPAGGYAVVPWPSNFSDGDAGGEVQLYSGGSFSNSATILDFVCWGVNPHGSRQSQAVSVGKWSGFCAPALTEGVIARIPGTTGTTADDYDTVSAQEPDTCAP